MLSVETFVIKKSLLSIPLAQPRQTAKEILKFLSCFLRRYTRGD